MLPLLVKKADVLLCESPSRKGSQCIVQALLIGPLPIYELFEYAQPPQYARATVSVIKCKYSYDY